MNTFLGGKLTENASASRRAYASATRYGGADAIHILPAPMCDGAVPGDLAEAGILVSSPG